MKLTTQSEYSLLALLYLARNYGDNYISLSSITKRHHLPFKYMERLMHVMTKAGIISSMKGRHGGYRLAHRPEEITIAEIIRLMDGPLAPIGSVSRYFYKPTVIDKEKKLIKIMKNIRDYISSKLESTTLKDIC